MNDPELPFAIAFFFFGIGFFIFILHYVHRDSYKRRDDMREEAREFGYEGSRLQKEALAYKPKK